MEKVVNDVCQLISDNSAFNWSGEGKKLVYVLLRYDQKGLKDLAKLLRKVNNDNDKFEEFKNKALNKFKNKEPYSKLLENLSSCNVSEKKKFSFLKKLVSFSFLKTLTEFLENLENDVVLFNYLTEEEINKPGGIADMIALEVKDSLRATQLRKIFNEIRALEKSLEKENGKSDYKDIIFKLYPLLAYVKGRGLIPEEFYEFMKFLLEKSENNREMAEKTVEIVKAIVGYHKFYNPKS